MHVTVLCIRLGTSISPYNAWYAGQNKLRANIKSKLQSMCSRYNIFRDKMVHRSLNLCSTRLFFYQTFWNNNLHLHLNNNHIDSNENWLYILNIPFEFQDLFWNTIVLLFSDKLYKFYQHKQSVFSYCHGLLYIYLSWKATASKSRIYYLNQYPLPLGMGNISQFWPFGFLGRKDF